jgi:hypothetical protein
VTIQDLGSIGELVAALATVATLAYLALQIRQNTRQLRDNARAIRLVEVRATTDGEVEFRRLLLANPEADDIRHRANAGEELDPLNARRFDHIMWDVTLRSQARWYLVQQSILSEAYWDRVSRIQTEYFRSKEAQRWWSDNRGVLDPRFAADIDRRLKAMEPAA